MDAHHHATGNNINNGSGHHDTDNNLKSYIQDLKKAAKSNTKQRVNGSQNRIINN